MTNVTIDDEQFGLIKWEAEYGWWSGTCEPSGSPSPVRLHVHTPDAGDLTITAAARSAFTKVMASVMGARLRVRDKLLAVFNESWNDVEPIDGETFMRRLQLEAVNIYPEGVAEVYFADDDMFWGHVIILTMSAEGEYTNATIAG